MKKSTDAERRALAAWTARGAKRVLPLFEAVSDDPRPRAAIAAALALGRGGDRTAALRTAALGALAAARAVKDPAAIAAARACGYAGSSAFIHVDLLPTQVLHALYPPLQQVLARQHAAGDAAAAREVRWAITSAPPLVRALVRKFAPRAAGRTPRAQLLAELDAGLR